MKAQLSQDATIAVAGSGAIVPATIYLFELEPVVSRLASAGSSLANPERLRAVCEKHVRSIVASDLVMFGEMSFYLVVTSCTGLAAAGLASFVNSSLLMLLFGTEQLSPDQNITLYRDVTSEASPAVATAKMGALVTTNPPPSPMAEDLNADDADDALYELANNGVYPEQGVELSFFPVHDLRRKAVSALFCAPTFAGAVFGHSAFNNLGPAQLPYIDRAILMHSLNFARKLASQGIIVAVGAPVSFETLAWSKSRQIYQRALRSTQAAQTAQLILKLEDIPQGTPAERIAQVVSSLRPFARHIFVHLPDNSVRLTMTGRMGASGLVLSLQRRAALPEVLTHSKWMARAALAQGAMSCIDHVESDESLAMVRSAGIRFAVGNVFGSQTISGRTPPDEVHDIITHIEQTTAAHLSAIA
jgi:hypothetical protein